jgi:hypothetical protein
MESPPRERINGAHVNTSPHPPSGALPSQNIFNIRIDNDNERADAKKGRDARNRTRDPRRSSESISPNGFPSPTFRKLEKYAAEPMFRGGSNNGSDTDSSFAGSSSVYSASDGSVFSEPERIHMKSAQIPIRSHMSRPRDDGFVQPVHTDYDRRGKANYAQANDYPPHRTGARSPAYDDHIIQPTSSSWQRQAQLARRHSAQPNPFDPSPRYAGQRSMSYTEPERRYPPVQPTQRYIAEREHDSMDMQDFADAVDLIKQQRRQAKAGRRGNVRVPVGGFGMSVDTDEWANPNRAARYERVHPEYSGYRHV